MKDANNEYVFNEEPMKKGKVDDEFIKRNNLTTSSHPADWFKAFLSNKVDKTVKYGTDLWTTYTNLKGLLSNIGHHGRTYSAFKPFSPLEIMNFIGLIIFNGLVPSMRFEYKFKTQMEDPVAGNDLCARVFGENAERRWKEFKYCFSLTDPRATVPSKKSQPNYKVQAFMDHIQKISHEAWIPGKLYLINQMLLNYYLFTKDHMAQ